MALIIYFFVWLYYNKPDIFSEDERDWLVALVIVTLITVFSKE